MYLINFKDTSLLWTKLISGWIPSLPEVELVRQSPSPGIHMWPRSSKTVCGVIVQFETTYLDSLTKLKMFAFESMLASGKQSSNSHLAENNTSLCAQFD